MLTGDLISLREVREEDIPKMWKMKNAPSGYEFFYELHPITLDMQKKWISKITSDPTEILFAIADLEDNFIGFVSLYHIDMRNRKCEYGRLLLDSNYKGKGIGRQVETLILEYGFKHLGMNKIYCEVLASNEKVIELHKKTGFKVAGIFKNHIFKNGSFVDVVYMEIFNENN